MGQGPAPQVRDGLGACLLALLYTRPMPEIDPIRTAVVSVFDEQLREELTNAEEQYRRDLAEALTAKGRALELIRTLDRPFEHAEAELETEHQQLVQHHTDTLVNKIR